MAKYIYDFSKLRGRIREKIGTECEFAKQIGRTQNYLTSVFASKSYFTPNDISTICKVLDIDHLDIPIYFFVEKVHANGTEAV